MSGAAAPTAAAESNRAPTASAREHTKKAPKTVAARIVKVLGADCGLDPGTKLLSVVSEWMETSPLVYRVCGEVYRPPHKWSDLAGAAKRGARNNQNNMHRFHGNTKLCVQD